MPKTPFSRRSSRLFVHLKSFQGQSRFSTWLTRIAINEALMLIRKRRPGHFSIEGHQTVDEESFTLEIKDQAATPEEEYGQLEIHNVLSGAIDELRPILKTVVNLSEIGELSTRKTAVKPSAYGSEPSKPEPFALAVCCATKSPSASAQERTGPRSPSFLARRRPATPRIRPPSPSAPPSSLLSGGLAVRRS